MTHDHGRAPAPGPHKARDRGAALTQPERPSAVTVHLRGKPASFGHTAHRSQTKYPLSNPQSQSQTAGGNPEPPDPGKAPPGSRFPLRPPPASPKAKVRAPAAATGEVAQRGRLAGVPRDGPLTSRRPTTEATDCLLVRGFRRLRPGRPGRPRRLAHRPPHRQQHIWKSAGRRYAVRIHPRCSVRSRSMLITARSALAPALVSMASRVTSEAGASTPGEGEPGQKCGSRRWGKARPG
jgi:hypothetical protein